MATSELDPPPPKTFVVYSWDDEFHKEWVKKLATRLRAQDGVDVTLDLWHSAPGEETPLFMERGVRENDFVIVVCTPRYRTRLDGRVGSVGYEARILTGYILTDGDEVTCEDKRKIVIPVLRRGNWRDAAPSWLLGTVRIDLSMDPYSELEYDKLLRTLHDAREDAPPIGRRPNFGDNSESQARPVLAPISVAEKIKRFLLRRQHGAREEAPRIGRLPSFVDKKASHTDDEKMMLCFALIQYLEQNSRPGKTSGSLKEGFGKDANEKINTMFEAIMDRIRQASIDSSGSSSGAHDRLTEEDTRL